MRHENAYLLRGQNLDYHCHCPPKILIKLQETGGTVTHTLQVLHSLQWHQPSKDERALRPKSLSLACHSYTHTLLGSVDECVTGPRGLPVKGTREPSATKRLWPNRDATTHSLSGLRGKECSGCVHSEDVKVVGLPSPHLAEVQFGDCVISARFSLDRKIQSR